MPLVHDVVNALVENEKPKEFLDDPKHVKAYEDFCYLVQQSNLSYFQNLKHLTLSNTSCSFICDCVVLGVDVKDGVIDFPKTIIHREDKAYVATVLYKNDKVEGVYLHSVKDLKEKTGMLSPYKYSSKTGMYSIKTAKYAKWGDKKFGYVLKDYIS